MFSLLCSISLRAGGPLSHARAANSESARKAIPRGEVWLVRVLSGKRPRPQGLLLDDFQNGTRLGPLLQSSALFTELIITSEIIKWHNSAKYALLYVRSLPAFLFHLEIVWDPPGGDRLLFYSLLTSNPVWKDCKNAIQKLTKIRAKYV